MVLYDVNLGQKCIANLSDSRYIPQYKYVSMMVWNAISTGCHMNFYFTQNWSSTASLAKQMRLYNLLLFRTQQ